MMACGALRPGNHRSGDGDGQHTWVKPVRGERFLFPVQALSTVFRGKFLAALASDTARLPDDPADTAQRKAERAAALARHAWVVYAKTPLAGPAVVLDYLSRYTHRTAIGNERLVAIDGDQVRLRVRADEQGAKRCIALPGDQFITRLLQHVLPAGFKRIRHYGLLAPAAKSERLALARQLLAMPQANALAREDAQSFMRRVAAIDIGCCSHCKLGRWVVIACVLAQRRPGTDNARSTTPSPTETATAAPEALRAACRRPP